MADATAGGHRPAPAATGACRCSEGFPDGRFPSPSPLSGDEIFQDRRATLTSFAGIAMRLYTSIALSNSSLIHTRGTHGAVASTSAGRIHATGHHPHRRLALSRRLSGCELQLRAHQALRADARARQVRRLLHGRPPGRAEHADRRTQAQPHGDLVRAVHAAVGAGGSDRAYRSGRHRLDHVRCALSRRAPVCVARPHQRRPRRLEYRHHFESGRGVEFRAHRSHGARRALSPRARVLRRSDGTVGQLGG